MKKTWFTLLITIVLSIGLVACGNTADPVDGTKEVSDLTAKEVYKNALEAAEKLESAEASLELIQNISVPSENMQMDTDTKMDIQMTMDPLTMYQKSNIQMKIKDSQEDTPMDMMMEMYMTEDGVYMYDSETDTWFELDSMIPDEVLNQQQSPDETLKMVEEFVDEFNFEQTDDTFVLKLTADGKKFKNLTEELLAQSLPADAMAELEGSEENVLENMKINKFYYELHLDKKTYDLKILNLDMDMVLPSDEGEMNIVQKTKTEYTNINGIDPIKVPQDIIDSAESLY